jgi:DNA replication initiation complex subunit (GINS family)
LVEVKITYETLFDLLRREKSRNELQFLDKTFYYDLIAYLKEKKGTIRNEDHHTLLFSKGEQEKIKIQIKNIQKILRELYELREKKIINLAVNKVRTESNLIDTSTLLPEEINLFDETCILLTKYKEGVLYNVLRLDAPSIELDEHKISHSSNQKQDPTLTNEYQEDETYNKESLFDSYKKEDTQNTKSDYSEKQNTTFSQAHTIEQTSENEKMIKVKILNDLPKFIGQNKNIYGPFKKEDITELPESITTILLKKGRLELI